MHAQLIPLEGGPPVTLSRDITLVGRKQGVCDFVLDRGSISKMHCLIVKTDGLLFIRDLGSTNGTKVNGQRVTRGALLPGDELAFASVKFRVHLGPAPADEDDAEPDHPTEMITSFPAGRRSAPPERFSAEADSDSDVRLLED